ncbi:MAG TPA: winged helix-turn-helix domain-containing protein [Pyrinomonadaceae bacterium]|jgi:DNA-binding winged helix-turn-helix (wHTH) protein/TolB-like protein/Flp pilus assembly protein TadD
MGDNSFSGFDLDAERKILRRGGEIVPLPPKAVELLVVLLKNRGEVVSKAELLDAVWEETVVEESVLSNNIYILRKTLSELGVGRNLIQTVPRRGYRFVADADEPGNDAEIVVERHVFRQALIEEILGELESRVPPTRAEDENPELLEMEFAKTLASARKSTESINSIAVLPLVNDSGDADLDYLSDGIAESLIDNLSLLPRLRVMARTTVFRYKAPGGAGGSFSPQQIGAELDVEAIVTGRIRLFKGSLIIKIELVRTADAAQLWGEQYQRETGDVLEIQSAIAREVSGKLHLKLTRRETRYFPRRETVSSDAYHFYLKGRYFWNKRTAQWMKKGIESFQQALDCDPNYALAYSGLADSYVSFATVGALSPSVAVPKARAAANKALELNDRLAEAHAALGFIKNSYDWDSIAAEQHFKRATEINPNYALAYHWNGFCLIAQRKFAESIELMKQAQALDPLSPIIDTVCGLPFYYMRRYGRAIEIYRAALDTDAAFFPGYAYLGMAYEQNGLYEESVAAFRQALSYAPGNTFALASLGHVYAVSGSEEKTREIIGKLEIESGQRYVSAYGMAEIYAGLKDNEQALRQLELAAEERSWWLIFANVNPRFDGLQGEPRFREILQKINLTK